MCIQIRQIWRKFLPEPDLIGFAKKNCRMPDLPELKSSVSLEAAKAIKVINY